MKKRLFTLFTAAGCLTAAAESVHADWSPGPFAGPYQVYPVVGDTTFKSLDLGGPVAPAGIYSRATVTADWNRAVASGQWQDDSRMSLTQTAITGTSTLSGTIYYGGVNGTIPTTAAANNTPGTIRWTNVSLGTPFVADGSNTIYLAYRTTYNLGTADVTWSNITATFVLAPPPPENQTCATAIDVSAAANAALVNVNDAYAAPAAQIEGANPTTLPTSPFSCQTTVSRATWLKFQPAVTRQYTIGSCNAIATQNTMANNVIGVFEASTGGDPCAGLTQIACSTTACTGGVTTLASLDSSKTYYICIARTGTSSLGAAEIRSQVFIQIPDAPTCSTNTETEPNDTFATANLFNMNVGDTVCGTSSGTSTSGGGVGTVDFFVLKTAPHAGIKKHRVRIASATAGHTLTTRGIGQNTGGIPNTTETELNNSVTTTNPARMLQWYTLGNDPSADDRKFVMRVAGVTATTSQYSVNYISADDVTPTPLARNLTPGSVSFSTVNVAMDASNAQNDTDFWVYDSNFNPIAQFGNDDSKVVTSSFGSDLTRTMTEGTYYIAITRYNLQNNMASNASDEDFQTGPMQRYSGVLTRGTVTSGITFPYNVSFKITDGSGEIITPAAITDVFDVQFFKIVVGNPVVNQRCQPADIACDDGTPLPADTGLHPNGGVNEGDYNSFFQGFFDAAANCDIANDDATPRAPFGVDGVNGGVNEGDYNCFFQKFFDGCPA